MPCAKAWAGISPRLQWGGR